MSFFINIIIFLIILFLYIHIVQQLKRSEDLEIYEMDYISNEQLQEVCDIKQPILFEYASISPDLFEKMNADLLLDNNGQYDVKVKECADYYKTITFAEDTKQDLSIDYIILPFHSCHGLMNTDPKSNYFSENNDIFLEDSHLAGSLFRDNDIYLKPSFTVQTRYDIQIGSKGATTPLRYHTNYRNFLCVNSGKITIKMTPWKSSKYLYPVKDYSNYEFRSPVNVWKPQKTYLHDMDKLKFLEFDVPAGKVVYIPPYWWYSIKYSMEPDTIVSSFTYNSIMNCLTNIPNLTMYFIQQSNTTIHPIKKMIASKYESSEQITEPLVDMADSDTAELPDVES